MRRLPLAVIGCGDRGRTYADLAAGMPERYRLVAAADPRPERVERIRAVSGTPEFRGFASGDELLAAPRLAEVVVIATQDADHLATCQAALERGYDVLLEKPIACDPAAVLFLEAEARRLGRRVLVCHVLRYAPLYRRVQAIVAGGHLGDLVTIEAREGIGPFHFAHSYVRGHWAVTTSATPDATPTSPAQWSAAQRSDRPTEEGEVGAAGRPGDRKGQSPVAGGAAPMVIAKCSHDLDIIAWLADRPCVRVDSHGGLTHFTAGNRPPEAPPRCTDGCAHAARCPYDALRYIDRQRGWLDNVLDAADTADAATIRTWLERSPWGRCVYACDNDACDHQVVSLAFADGPCATLTISAFAEGRELSITGTRGHLEAGARVARCSGHDIVWEDHVTGERHCIDLSPDAGDGADHGGGDPGLIAALHAEMTRPADAALHTGLSVSVYSHLIGFAAEAARLRGHGIDLARYRAEQEARAARMAAQRGARASDRGQGSVALDRAHEQA